MTSPMLLASRKYWYYITLISLFRIAGGMPRNVAHLLHAFAKFHSLPLYLRRQAFLLSNARYYIYIESCFYKRYRFNFENGPRNDAKEMIYYFLSLAAFYSHLPLFGLPWRHYHKHVPFGILLRHYRYFIRYFYEKVRWWAVGVVRHDLFWLFKLRFITFICFLSSSHMSIMRAPQCPWSTSGTGNIISYWKGDFHASAAARLTTGHMLPKNDARRYSYALSHYRGRQITIDILFSFIMTFSTSHLAILFLK